MLTKERLDFILQITQNFHGHWEDPGWGQNPKNQVLVMMAIDELANGIEDKEVNSAIHRIVEKTIVNISKQIASTQDLNISDKTSFKTNK